MIRRYPLLPALVPAIALMAPPALAVPDTAAPSNADRLRHDLLRSTPVGAAVRIDDFELPGGERIALDLERFEILRPDAQLVIGTPLGELELQRPDVVLLSGHVVGDERSTAYIALSPYGTNGFIDHGGAITSISTGAFDHAADLREALRVASVADMLADAPPPTGPCGLLPPGAALPMPTPAPERRGAPECRVANIAIDTDWPYTDRLFAGDTDASAAYAVSLLGAVSEIYQRDLGIRLALGFLRVWAADIDPFTGGAPLNQITNYWPENMSHVDRTFAHFLSGLTPGGFGGGAWVGTPCDPDFGYSASQNLNGSFPYPLMDNNESNWDLYILAHTLGHNFGAFDTH